MSPKAFSWSAIAIPCFTSSSKARKLTIISVLISLNSSWLNFIPHLFWPEKSEKQVWILSCILWASSENFFFQLYYPADFDLRQVFFLGQETHNILCPFKNIFQRQINRLDAKDDVKVGERFPGKHRGLAVNVFLSPPTRRG